jgi:hypothetical protein
MVESLDVLPGPVSGCGALLQLLGSHLTDPELAVVCAYGLGVCAMKGQESEFSNVDGTPHTMIHQSIAAIFAQLQASASTEDDDQLCVRDSLISSLLKFCIFRYGSMDDKIREECVRVACHALPLTNDNFEARSLHQHIVALLEGVYGGGVTLPSQVLLSLLFGVVAKLAAAVMPSPEDTEKNTRDCAHLDHWNEQIVGPITYHRAKAIIRAFVEESSYYGQSLSSSSSSPHCCRVSRGTVDTWLSAQASDVREALAVIMQ